MIVLFGVPTLRLYGRCWTADSPHFIPSTQKMAHRGDDRMEIIIKGDAKEIAALVVAIQGRRMIEDSKEMMNAAITELNRKTREGGKTVLLC